jgi:hypothetical protein
MNLRWLPWTALLVALGAVVFLVVRPTRPTQRAEDVLTRPPEATPRVPAPLEATQFAPAPRPAASPSNEPAGPRGSVDWRNVPRGALEVVVVDENDAPLPLEAVNVEVGPGPAARPWLATPLLVGDADTKSWRSDEIPAGPVDVRVTGDHVLPKTLTVKVSAAGDEVKLPAGPLQVKVQRAGAIAYAVKLSDGTVPAHVTLTLLDARERPLTVGYQARSETEMSTRRIGTKATQGPEGVVFGVPAGRYTLRATSPADETLDTFVDVLAGETVTVAISIRG